MFIVILFILGIKYFTWLFFFFSIPVVIVGNKTDLHRERVVSTEQGKRLADTWKASFYEVSARSHEVIFKFTLLLITCNIIYFIYFFSPFVKYSTV